MSVVWYQYALHHSPEDYPGKYVIRRWVVARMKLSPLGILAKGDTREEVEKHLPKGVTFTPRMEEDVKSLVGVWI